MIQEHARTPRGWAKTRPLRVAFLLDLSDDGDRVLDAIFANCYGRWSGRYTLVVPCANGQVNAAYWAWLEAYDPDIVYAYTDLTSDEILQVHERLAPADYLRHRGIGNSRDANWFRAEFPYPLLSSLSVLFRLSRHSPVPAEGPAIKLINAWHTETESRLMADNLGTYSLSALTGSFPNDARPAAQLLTIVSDKFAKDHRYGIRPGMNTVPDEAAAISEFAHGRATAMSLLSSFFATRLEIRQHAWSDAFSLVVGDSAQDRLLFWNSRLLIPTWLDRDLCCWRVSQEQLDDAEFVAALARMLNARNHVNGGAGGQPRIAVRSCSHDLRQLQGVVEALRAAKVWSQFNEPRVVAPEDLIPDAKALQHAKELAHAGDSGLRATWTQFDWVPPQATLPQIEPEHLADAPPQQHFTQGMWALDVRLENPRSGESTLLSNDLALPKRWRLANAFLLTRRERDLPSALPPGNRRSRGGNLTVFNCHRLLVESVTVPSLLHAFHVAFCRDEAPRYGDDQPPWPQAKAVWLRPSNEAQYLTGVLGLAGGLGQAKRLLLHPFLREVFASIGAAPGIVDAETVATANALAKRGKGHPSFDLTDRDELNALALLIVKAAKSIKAPRFHIPLEELQLRWEAYRKIFWEAHENQRAGASADVDWESYERQTLNDCLVELRQKRMLFQGYPWTCAVCKHRNWVDFQALKGDLPCEVCKVSTALPVNVSWHFRANEFLLDSLRTRSALSVLWTLSALQSRARESFFCLGPTAFGYTSSEKPSAEADLLVLLDGRAVLCEVKASWTSVRSTDIAALVNLAQRLRPDTAVLAVMENGGARLKRYLDAARTQLSNADIGFEVITPVQYQVSDNPMLSA